jgi:predicted nucleic acid-binding protein
VPSQRTFIDSGVLLAGFRGTGIEDAEHEAETFGLSAMDALHIAAAKRAECDELVTTEKTTKPLFRVTGIIVTCIR